MLTVSTNGTTLQEALDRAEKVAISALVIDGEVAPFQRVGWDISTKTQDSDDEVTRFAGTVTFSVETPRFGVQIDHEGAVTVDLPGVDLGGLSVGGAPLLQPDIRERTPQ